MIRKLQTISYYFITNFNASKDYYKTLNINKAASHKQIKKSFLKLAKLYHPDSNKGQEQKFKQINQAYQILSSQHDRRDYDAARNQTSQTSQTSHNSSSFHQSPYRQPYSQTRQNPDRNTYRGYSSENNWSNPYFRQKTMDDLYRRGGNSKYPGRNPSQKDFEEMIKQRSNSNNTRGFKDMYDEHDEILRKHAEQIRITKQQVQKAYREEQKRRSRQYREYQQKSAKDLQKQIKQKAWKMAEGIKNNVDGAVRMGKYIKSFWDDFTKKDDNKKK